MYKPAKYLVVIVSVTLFLANIDFAFSLTSSSVIGGSTELVIGINNLKPEAYAAIVNEIGGSQGKIVDSVTMKGNVIALIADVPSSAISFFTERLQRNNLARYVEPNMIFHTQFTPNDPNWTIQWGPKKIEADFAWNTTLGNRNILVAAVDTGIDYTHPDLAANYVPLGYDWVNNDFDPMDDNGHGTHVSGIIAAVLNNSVGVAGIANVSLMMEKAFDASGMGFEDDLAQAIIHAVDQGTDVLSNSWGSTDDSLLIHDAVKYAYDHGVLVVAAAGNEASTDKVYPAAYDEVVAVTATDQHDSPASFTSYGDWVELAAPGVNIYSTMPTYSATLNDPPYNHSLNYDYLSGTSMACPHVTGEAALAWSLLPTATRNWVRAKLWFSADDLWLPGFDQVYGYGRINARKAVEASPAHELLIFDFEKPKHVQAGNIAFFNITVLNLGASDEYDLAVQLFVDSSLADSTIVPLLTSGESTSVTLSWNPSIGGIFNVTSYVLPVLSEAEIRNNAFSQTVSVIQMSLDPVEAPAGAKVTVNGVGFLAESQVTITFNDMLMGYTLVGASGNFTFIFNIPFATAGESVVKTFDSEGDSSSATFTVVDVTPLSVQIDAGAIHFTGEAVESYVQTTLKGELINATITDVVLHKPDGTIEDLTTQQLAEGVYKIDYTLVGNETGTYLLDVSASYVTDTVNASGTAIKCFMVSDILALMSKQIVEVKDGIAVLQTDLGFARLNLTAMNATLENIFLEVIAINGTTAIIQTSLGTLNGSIMSIEGDMATIMVPGVGTITTDISSLKGNQYLMTVIALVAVAVSALTIVFLVRRKAVKTE